MRGAILNLLTCSLLGFGFLSQAHAAAGDSPIGRAVSPVITAVPQGNFHGQCVKPPSEPVAIGDFGDHISIGPSFAAQILRYDLASKKAAFNTGLGAGFSVRVYGKTRSMA